jgi:hypothetical protein
MNAASSNAASSATQHAGTNSEASGEAVADLIFDAVYGAAIGGSAIAVFFLIADVIAGRPLFTPSLIGSVLFTGTNAAAVTEIRLDMVAYVSVVHFGTFLALGAAISLMCRWTGLSKTSPTTVTVVVFLLLTGGFFLGGRLLMPGVGDVVGAPSILAANLLTAVSMAAFLQWAHSD